MAIKKNKNKSSKRKTIKPALRPKKNVNKKSTQKTNKAKNKKIKKINSKKTNTKNKKRSYNRKKTNNLNNKNKLSLKTPPVFLKKYELNPVIEPVRENNWECFQTFNPGVILLNDKIHFIYRAIGGDGISRLGYASSKDGFFIDERYPYPVYEHKINDQGIAKKYFIYSVFSGGSFGGAEDPRLVRVEDEDKIYMTYTACDNGLRMALTSIKINDFLNKNWNWAKPYLISPPGEVHKNWVIFPEKINGKYAILHSLSPEIKIAYRDSLDFKEGEFIDSFYNGFSKKNNGWDNWIRGAGAPPIKTKLGWLVFYHAMTNGEFHKYKVGAMILDYKDPTKIILKSNFPILVPSEDYENCGFKGGVVYVTGAVLKDGNLFIYYGAADSYIAVAYYNLEEFLNNLQNNLEPVKSIKKIKIRKN
jgi:predicted GH43/DUF377 family glycosyl hydrolase